ncbi:MAG TPA: hypothetical protein VMO47_16570 [Rhodothermales bacterium]|nr:hypothetical protein [Rhodothermales bacterium]
MPPGMSSAGYIISDMPDGMSLPAYVISDMPGGMSLPALDLPPSDEAVNESYDINPTVACRELKNLHRMRSITLGGLDDRAVTEHVGHLCNGHPELHFPDRFRDLRLRTPAPRQKEANGANAQNLCQVESHVGSRF